ncbi:ATP-binding protein [Sorangium sp. So ce1000]|uniref:ATP-binding protein n=1 Tax=Sorangium sp. So ce1000 TaxID=3133325 RepID=UPI003F61A2EA
MGTSAHTGPSPGPATRLDTTDIEALKRELERLRAVGSRDRGWLDAVLEHSPHGVIICDASGKLVLHNRAAERIWAGSASTESIDDWTLYRAFHEDGRPYEAQDWAMARAMAERQVIESEETRIQRFDGTYGMVLGSAAPIIGPRGELEGGISVFADISRLKQVEAERGELAAQLTRRVEELDRRSRLTQALLAVSSALSGAVTIEQVSAAVVSDIHRVLGASMTTMYTADEAAGVATLVGHSGIEEHRTSPYARVPLDARLPLSDALRERRPIWVDTRRSLHAAYPELAALRPVGDDVKALAVLPIVAHAALLGGLAFSFASERAWSPEEREFLLSVAAQCASALDRARLLEQEREARARAEMLAAELERQQATLRLLSEAGAALSGSLDVASRLAHLTHLAVPTLADWCAVDMLNGDAIECVAVHHCDPAKIELAERLRAMAPPRPDAPAGVPAVIRTGRSEWMADIPDAAIESAALSPEHLRLIRSLGLRSYVVVPLRGRDRTIGALTLVHAESGRRFSEADVALAEELANRLALLIDNARLFQEVDGSRRQLAGLFHQAPAGICILRGPRHVFELVNPTCRDIFGGREVMGKPIREALPDLSGQGMFEILDEVYRSGQPHVGTSVPLRLRRGAAGPEEERFFNFVYQSMSAQGSGAAGVVVFAFEVTDQIQARRRVEQLAAEQAAVAMDNARLFQEAQSLIRALERTNAELDQFAYVTSHDLKAPLRGIASLAQWIEEDLSDKLTADTRHQMELLRGRVRRMEALIEGILAYSRATRFREKPESVDLDKLAKEVVELIAPRPPARVTLDVPPATLRTYRVPLQQVLMNLITNGLKHAGREDAAVSVSAREQGDRIEISVSDNGPGIAPAFHEKVWGMFQTLQARDKVESTGIGLAIVRKIVESRGGRAWVESDGKSGATFRFTWPKREEAQGAA